MFNSQLGRNEREIRVRKLLHGRQTPSPLPPNLGLAVSPPPSTYKASCLSKGRKRAGKVPAVTAAWEVLHSFPWGVSAITPWGQSLSVWACLIPPGVFWAKPSSKPASLLPDPTALSDSGCWVGSRPVLLRLQLVERKGSKRRWERGNFRNCPLVASEQTSLAKEEGLARGSSVVLGNPVGRLFLGTDSIAEPWSARPLTTSPEPSPFPHPVAGHSMVEGVDVDQLAVDLIHVGALKLGVFLRDVLRPQNPQMALDRGHQECQEGQAQSEHGPGRAAVAAAAATISDRSPPGRVAALAAASSISPGPEL